MKETKPPVSEGNESDESAKKRVYTVSEDQSMSHALITAFEQETDLDLTTGEPINNTVDLEALDQFYPANTEAGTAPRIQFTYRDHEVTIESRDEIHISSDSPRQPRKQFS